MSEVSTTLDRFTALVQKWEAAAKMLRDELTRATARAVAAERVIAAARVVTERLSYVDSDALDELRAQIRAYEASR